MAPTSPPPRELVGLDDREAGLLEGRERPIVDRAAARAGAPVAPSVAPLSPDLGVMLPYSPLHTCCSPTPACRW